jgi:indole-3-glycerol phosphate synthase
MTILDDIIANKRREVAARQAARPLATVRAGAATSQPPRDFRAALTSALHPAPRVIAEIKRRSPSKGILLPDLDPASVAAIYEQNGAAAISVLADARFFGGSLDDLIMARHAVSIPVLCKEFVVESYQVYEAREAGADAILLLASVLDSEQLRAYRRIASDLGMGSLVEVHTLAELESALASGASIIGINNRDLRTFNVSLETTRSLLPAVPLGIVTVSESGIHTTSDRNMLENLGVDALLVGEGLLTAPDLALATRAICGLPVAINGMDGANATC